MAAMPVTSAPSPPLTRTGTSATTRASPRVLLLFGADSVTGTYAHWCMHALRTNVKSRNSGRPPAGEGREGPLREATSTGYGESAPVVTAVVVGGGEMEQRRLPRMPPFGSAVICR